MTLSFAQLACAAGKLALLSQFGPMAQENGSLDR
jgi:hypothetical protein